MTFTISSLDEFNSYYPVVSVESKQEAYELLETIDSLMDTATGPRYYELQEQFRELQEQLSMT